MVLLPSWTDSWRKLSKRALGAAWMPSEPASSVLITSLRALHPHPCCSGETFSNCEAAHGNPTSCCHVAGCLGMFHKW